MSAGDREAPRAVPPAIDPVPLPDLSAPRRLHVVNVGGAGMSALATVLAQMGHVVSGVDDRETPFLAPLRDLGVTVVVGSVGLHPDRPADYPAAWPDAVVVSTATPEDHPDVVLARSAGVPVAHRRDALAAVCATRRTTAVAGTHGKSTTAGLLATIAARTGGDGYLVGTRVTGLGANADWRDGPGFVIEADESDGTFLRLGATDAVVTNLEADHLAFWGTEAALVAGFEAFLAALPGTATICADDPGSAALVGPAVAAGTRVVTYGTGEGVPGAPHVVLADVAPSGLGVTATLHLPAEVTGGRDAVVALSVPAAPGIHNARNAAAAVTAAVVAGTDPHEAARALTAFAGVARRFEARGRAGGVTFVDSYDHLPTEVAAALAAAAGAGFARVVCAFQPHRYTRTRDLAHTFADAFVDADLLAVTDLYPAGEAPIEGVSGRLVVDAVVAAHPDADVAYLPDLDAAEAWLLEVLRPGDLCLTLNAGDLTAVPDRVLAALAERDGSAGAATGGSDAGSDPRAGTGAP